MLRRTFWTQRYMKMGDGRCDALRDSLFVASMAMLAKDPALGRKEKDLP